MDKKAIALQALDQHPHHFGIAIPERLRAFFTDEAWTYDGKCMPPGTQLPMMEEGSFRLRVTLPSWVVLGELYCDDAIVGPNGEWESAKNHVPIFMCDQSKLVVYRLDDGTVGWFEEECFDENDDGYREGVFHLADSLDAFLATLVELEKATWETEPYEDAWETDLDEL